MFKVMRSEEFSSPWLWNLNIQRRGLGKMLKNIQMCGTRFGLDLNLQNVSMISIATKLWDSQDIKNHIKKDFLGRGWDYPDKNWCEISKIVVEYTNSIKLPTYLSVLLKKMILLIGQKIYDWIFYVTKMFKLDLISTQKIYFSYGVVDEIKIFDFYWRDLMASDNFIYQSKYFRHSPLFSLACIYGCEKFVKERKNEMLEELSEFYPDIKTGDEIYNIISVSICMTEQKSILENVASPRRMYELCLEVGFSKAARFFWEKLDEVEKVENLTDFAMKCFLYHCASFSMEKRCENLLFLINQMREEERYFFFMDYADEIITLFLPVWPYQELIVDLLKYDWNIESSRLRKMAYFVISFSKTMNRLEFPLDNGLVFQIMQKVWGNIPVDEKLRFFPRNQDGISDLFLILSPEILNLVFNDPSITEVDGKKKDYFIKEGFVELVKKGKFDFLNAIIESIFNYIPEPKEFLKEKFSDGHVVWKLIENDDSINFLDQFLDWSAESETERARLKDKINTIFVCRYLTEPLLNLPFKFELANKFLKWRFKTDAEIKSFKEEMKSYNFVIVTSSEYVYKYVRIKSGDLSWLRPEDFLVMPPDEDPCDNTDGLIFLNFEDTTELDRGVALGIKKVGAGVDYDLLGRDPSHPERLLVHYVGTKVGDYIVFNVREVWTRPGYSDYNLNGAVELSNAFIKFYYETDQEVFEFKRTKLLILFTENVIEFLLDAFRNDDRVSKSFLDVFCEFCMIPPEKIEEIKIQQRNGIEKFLDTYLIDECNFEFVDIYLNWLFGEVKKTDAMRKFLNSSNKGVLLCDSFLEQWGNVSPLGEWALMQIRRWLSMVDDIEKLKDDLFDLNEDTSEFFPALFDQ